MTILQQRPNFRADIEGLRSIAVLGVVFYHLDAFSFSGGFVGVDVFFVISGFLITQLLFRDIHRNGQVNLLKFWANRARRLLPNALLVLATSAILAAVFSPIHALEAISKDIAYAAGYFSNYHFSATATNYFSFETPPSPVLHFWSLSVEEQFYIVFPLIFAGLALWTKPARKWITLFLALTMIVSFSMMMIWTNTNHQAAFFHTESRIWQLASGGILASILPHLPKLSRLSCELISAIGISLIMFGFFGIKSVDTYPNLIAVLPVLGSLAILLSGVTNGPAPFISRILAVPPLTFLGARSYSLYLWHWPVLIFIPVLIPDLPVKLMMPLVFTISLALACLTYAFVENPVRYHKRLTQRNGLSLLLSGLGIALTIALALSIPSWVNFRPGIDQKYIAYLQSAWKDKSANYSDGCHIGGNLTSNPACIYGNPLGKKTVLLLGDSHAAQFLPALDKAASSLDWRVISWSKSSCPPALGVVPWDVKRQNYRSSCPLWQQWVNQQITLQKPDMIILTGSRVYSILDQETNDLANLQQVSTMLTTGITKFATKLISQGIPVILIQDTPRAFPNYRTCLEGGAGKICDRPRKQALGSFHPYRDAYQQIKEINPAGSNLQFLDLSAQICPNYLCPLEQNGIIVYRDKHHLTASFSRSLAPEFARVLRQY